MAPRFASAQVAQPAETWGCVTSASTGSCEQARALDSVFDVHAGTGFVYGSAGGSRALSSFARDAKSGALTQPDGEAGCASSDGSGGLCSTARGIGIAYSSAVSPDGRTLYVASIDRGSVISFARDPESGSLVQLPGEAGCMTSQPTPGCTEARGLAGASSVAVSPDGLHVYVAGDGGTPEVDGGIAVFARDELGALTQLEGTDGCRSETGYGGDCADDHALDGATRVAVSPDGKHVYATSLFSDAVAAFARDAETGKLTPLADLAGCVSETGSGGLCTDGRALDYPHGLVVSADGRFLYVASVGSSALAAFARDPATGALTQLAGTAGCVSAVGAVGCSASTSMEGPIDLAIAPNGRRLLVAAYNSSAVVAFARNPDTGVVSQIKEAGGCVSLTGPPCLFGRAIRNVSSISVTPDGAHAYTAAPTANAIAVFSITPLTTTIPACSDATIELAHDEAGTVPLACVDADGDMMVRQLATAPAHGTVGDIDQHTGTATYVPASGFAGSDSFTFTATDYDGTSAPATVTVRVAEAPRTPDPDPKPDPDPGATGDGGRAAAGPEPGAPPNGNETGRGPEGGGGPVNVTPPVRPRTKLRSRTETLAAVMAGIPSTRTCVPRGRAWRVRFGAPTRSDISWVEMSVNGGSSVNTLAEHLRRQRTWKVTRGTKVRVVVRVVFESRPSITGRRTYRFCRG